MLPDVTFDQVFHVVSPMITAEIGVVVSGVGVGGGCRGCYTVKIFIIYRYITQLDSLKIRATLGSVLQQYVESWLDFLFSFWFTI